MKVQKLDKSLNESLNEAVVLIDLDDFEPWQGAEDTWDKIINNNKLDEFEAYLDDFYPNGINKTELNDLLWFESDYILDLLNINKEDEFDENESLNEAVVKRDLKAYRPYTYKAKKVFNKILDAEKWDEFVDYIERNYPNGIFEDTLDILLGDYGNEILTVLNIQELAECKDKEVNEDITVTSDEFADNIELNQAEEFPEVSQNLGHYTEIVNAINGEWETINDYNIIIANLKNASTGEYDDLINVIKDIKDEEYKHIGQLQEILKHFSDDPENIESGEEEAKDQMQGEDIK